MSQNARNPQLQATFHSVNSSITAGNDINIVYNLNGAPDPPILTRLKASLNPVPSASYDSYEAKKRSECFPDTRVQVLSDIETWITVDNQAPIYVLDGVAGIGKSTIAQTIAARAAKLGLLGASFFFSRDEDLRRVAQYFFPTIAYQLARYEALFATHISDALDKDPDAPEKRLYQQFSLLLIEPLRDLLMERAKPTLIVVDALDECNNEGAEELLSLLGQYAHQLPGLKILITTRPEWHLRQILDQDQNHEQFRLHDIENSIVHSDIQLYLYSRLSVEEIRKVFPHRRTPWQPSAHDMKMLCGICGTLFIIAATATKFILNPQSSPQKQLSYLLDGVSQEDFAGSKYTNVLDETYLRIIFATQTDLDAIDENWFRDLNKVLGALITLDSPLPCEALGSLLDMDPDDLEAVLSNLHSLVAPSGNRNDIPKRIKKVLTNRKLARQTQIDNLLWIDVDDHQLQLAKACLRLMNSKLKLNMANIDQADWYQDKADIPHVKPDLISPDLAYAALHWASHLGPLRKPNVTIDRDLQSHLDTWASRHILSWIEVMSILNQVNGMHNILQDAIASIQEDNAVAAWTQSAKVKELLSDALRFVQQGRELMKLSPIHVYRTCLPFIPKDTALYRIYGTHAMLNIAMEKDTRWDPLLVTCVGHYWFINSVASSSDGSQLASGSEDKDIRLWNAKTGAHIQTLTGHSDGVRSVAFSVDGSQIASGSVDKTIRLWDAKTGNHIRTLAGHSDSIESVSFSNDGSQLASGSGDQTIWLWDAMTTTNTFVLDGHSGHVISVVFSPDSAQLASGSTDKTVRVWNAKNGAHIFTLAGHSGAVVSVAFSNDGSKLASGSNDATVRLWDTKAGIHSFTFTGHESGVTSVTFSMDSLLLVSGSQDGTIRIWDVKTGGHISTLLDQSSSGVTSVVFSADGSQLVSGSNDSSVRLWDAKTCIRDSPTPASSRHLSRVFSVAFSNDGAQLASGSNDNTIRLWEAKTGAHILSITGHSNFVSSVAFSNDDLWLASGSGDKTARLWDIKTGAQIFSLSGHSKPVISVAFSKDGLHLASGSNDRTIRLWDPKTGTHKFTLTGHSDRVASVAFTTDSSQLASGAYDKTVRLWDVQTGVPVLCLDNHADWIHSVAFSYNSQLLSVSDGYAVQLWDPQTGSLRSSIVRENTPILEFLSAVFLKGNDEDIISRSLLLLVNRDAPSVTGLIRATQLDGDEWDIAPLCWFPPHMEVGRVALNRSDCRVALGCTNGQVLVIDFSSEMSRLI